MIAPTATWERSKGVILVSKYNNRKVVVDGITFDSKKEAQRYGELKLLQQAGKIRDLQLQARFELIPMQREPDSIGPRGGVVHGRILERECCYFADFVYFDCEQNTTNVEDVKGQHKRLPEYVIKRKLMLWRYGIKIREV